MKLVKSQGTFDFPLQGLSSFQENKAERKRIRCKLIMTLRWESEPEKEEGFGIVLPLMQ